MSATCTSTTAGTYTFSLLACVAQWNEAATLDQCQSNPQREGPGGVTGTPPAGTPQPTALTSDAFFSKAAFPGWGRYPTPGIQPGATAGRDNE